MEQKKTPTTRRPPKREHIKLFKVSQNNLKNIDVEIPYRQFTVVTGVSGSGKSSLAFQTLYAEGQRRYVESLSTYTRQFLDKLPRPEVERVENIPPAIALEQRNNIVNNRSTVGGTTELYDYLRVLFARAGIPYCPSCNIPITRTTSETVWDYIKAKCANERVLLVSPLLKSHAPSTKETKLKGKKPKADQTLPFGTKLAELKARGIVRVLATARKPEEGEVYEVEELSADQTLQSKQKDKTIYAVMDRFKLTDASMQSERTRILDSIEAAFHFSDGHLALVNLEKQTTKDAVLGLGCSQCLKKYPDLEPLSFSSQSPLGACETCSGFGFNLELDEKLVVPNPKLTLKQGAIDPFTKPAYVEWGRELVAFARSEKIPLDVPYATLTPEQKKLLWNGSKGDKSFSGIQGCFNELKQYKYKIHVRVFVRRYQSQTVCLTCYGSKLKPAARVVRLGEINFQNVTDLTVEEALSWTETITLPHHLKSALADAFEQWNRRLLLLKEVGLSYLTLSRLSKTLSGGEFQRVNLATQLGNGLCGTLYVLDEPSIGLHPHDTGRLIRILKNLRDQGNTLVVVEHDLEVMRAADFLIELGPHAGRNGGNLIAALPTQDFLKNTNSLTAPYLNGTKRIARTQATHSNSQHRSDLKLQSIRITGCREHNLKNIDVTFPMNRWTIVTGVSGSGKSTLVHQILYRALARLLHSEIHDDIGRFDKLYGAQQLKHIALLDQSPIGKTSRSNPATYLKIWEEFRKLFALTPLASRRGYTPQYFSFNVDGGRCPTCSGEGEVALDMHFMAEIKLPCESCQGKRFKSAILEVNLRGKNAFEWLETTVDEAYESFRDHPVIAKKTKLLREVGLGYLRLGQPATTLSGGESQRLKIAATLDEKPTEPTLYVFDEPSTGLHLEDISKLILVFRELIERGHTIVMIEHHLDLIAQADWILDLGPTGGPAGGHLLFQGEFADLEHCEGSFTAQALKEGMYFTSTSTSPFTDVSDPSTSLPQP